MRLFERKHMVFAISVLAVAALAYAGVQARVQGKVTDNKGNPIPDAVVTIIGNPAHEVMDFEKIVKADKKGKFKALILDATRYYLFRVEAPGYQPQERPFKVGAGSTDNEFDFQLMSIAEATAASEIELRDQPGYKEFEEGKKLFADGDTEGARAKFEEAVAAKPDLLPALAGLAELSYDAGDMEGALAAARKCLELDDESVHCLAIAANASQALGDMETHAVYMAQYEALNPEDPTILFNQAAVFLNKMDDGGARPLLEKCLDADPDFPQCNFEYGMLLLRLGDMEGAKAHLEKYLEVAPDGPDAATAQETIKYL
ncbi:MAG: tetratricopeptide repeat protein [Acidobacteria bacterium]|nr:tetratricopeptide repeat protein [Candidatus Sulfomarinibacter sp. MAG AM1]